MQGIKDCFLIFCEQVLKTKHISTTEIYEGIREYMYVNGE
jgi:hypothetical protein